MSATVFYASSSEIATLTNTFTVDSAPADPTTVSLTVTPPGGGAATTYTLAAAQITHVDTGIFSKDISCSLVGVYGYVWEGTGAASDVVAGTWTVTSTAVQKLYATVEQIKSRFRISDTVDDFEIRLACEAASQSINDWCNRRFWAASETRTFEPSNWYCVEIDDLVSLTTLKTDSNADGTYDTTWSASDYQLLPVNPSADGETVPYDEIRAVGSQTFPLQYGPNLRTNSVQVVGVFGWPAVPAPVTEAALILTSELVKLRDAPFGVAGFGDYGAVRIRENPRVRMLLRPYVRDVVLIA